MVYAAVYCGGYSAGTGIYLLLRSMTFISAVIVGHVKGRPQQENVLKPWQQGAFYALLLIAVVSVYFSLDRFLSFWNLVYVVGQYAALFFVCCATVAAVSRTGQLDCLRG